MIYVMSGSGGGGLNGVALIWCEFPADSTSVVCSNGTKTYTVPAKWLSSGGYCFAVNAVGTWTLTAKKGTTNTAAKTVNVQAGQRYMVELSFSIWLFNAGDQCIDITGGWEITGGGGSVDFDETSMTIKVNTQGRVTLCTANRVPLAGIKTLHFYLKCSASYPTGYPYLGAGKVYSPSIANGGDFCASLQLTESSVYQDVALDVLNCNDGYFIALGGIYNGSVTITVQKIWGEKE